MSAEGLVLSVRAVNWRRILRAAIPVIVAAASATAALVAVPRVAFLDYADRFVGDWEIAALLPAEPQDSNVVVVAITEETLQQFPYRSPIDRRFLSDLLTTLAARQPRAIGVDILFDQATEPAKDEALRHTLRTLAAPLVVSYADTAVMVNRRQAEFLNAFAPPERRGLANLATDRFDTARWIFPGHAGPDGRFTPGFARAVADAAGAKTPDDYVEIAWHGQPAANVPAFRQYPAQMVKALPAAWFKDKVVLIGTDISLADRHRTPFSTLAQSGEAMMAGVVIQANAVAQLIEGRPPPTIGALNNVIIALVAAMIGALLPFCPGHLVVRIGAGVLVLVMLWTGGATFFHYTGLLVGLIAPTMALGASHWLMEAMSGNEARRQREFIKGAFGNYVSPKIVESLLQDPARIQLGGVRRVMTFMFTDVANFTTLSEQMDYRDLARTLNTYLEGLSRIVLDYDGTIVKFIGDGMFVIFNAPLDQPDHGGRTVRCALEIDRFAERFRAEQNAAGIPFGVTRIGIHSGAAVVGNFGSQTRFDYSAQGDTVNTASRLEGVNKRFATRICVSEATRILCEGIPFRPLGTVIVKGKSKGVAIWEPLHEEAAETGYVARYRAAFAKLESLAPDALAAFTALGAEKPEDGSVLLFLDRLSRGEQGAELVLTEK